MFTRFPSKHSPQSGSPAHSASQIAYIKSLPAPRWELLVRPKRQPVRSNRILPSEETIISRGSKFVCVIDGGGLNRTGKIYNDEGKICWQYGTRTNPDGRRWGNPLNKPDFVVTNTDGKAEIVIRRVSFLPSVFQIMDQDHSIGQIALRNILGIKYRIRIDGQASSTFRLPLFTVRFWGDTDTGPSIWVAVGLSKMQWSVLLKPGTMDRKLIASLAFIHNQWWNYS